MTHQAGPASLLSLSVRPVAATLTDLPHSHQLHLLALLHRVGQGGPVSLGQEEREGGADEGH